ncbi:hypothetical protein CC80DRAFT_552844 [Byssothecium circinans]|uniref:Uncharacterized protein n=1 Tax=Byssothecium circinans TaxID=147558 RepID=A0A6A5TGX1_9PLEO|nr:hypothetical protein CC80DRAFT_552844 [Byssothecium circinans]
MRRARNDTLRKRVYMIFGREFDALSSAEELRKTCAVRREIRDENVCEIATKTPEILVGHPDSTDIDVTKRHGIQLFKNTEATTLLYSDQIHYKHCPGSALSPSVMAKHITRTFMFGSSTDSGAYASSPASQVASLNPIEAFMERLPFGSKDSASRCTTDDGGSVTGMSSHAPNESELDVASIHWRRPYYQTAAAISEAGSILGGETSPGGLTPVTDFAAKRPFSLAAAMHTTEHCEPNYRFTHAKRPRDWSMLSSRLPRDIQLVEAQSPEPRSLASQQGFYIGSPASSIITTRHIGLKGRRSSLHGGRSETEQHFAVEPVMNSPSLYSFDRRSMVSQVAKTGRVAEAGYWCDPSPIKAYAELLPHRNPFSITRAASVHGEVTEQAAMLKEHNQGLSNHSDEILLDIASRRRAAGAIHAIDIASQANGAPAADSRPQVDKTIKPRPLYVLYKSSLKSGMFYRAPADASSIEGFVQSQKRIDPRSTFWYVLEGKDKKYASTHHHLHHAIHKYGLDTVALDTKFDFPQFMQLPREIRDCIYDYALADKGQNTSRSWIYTYSLLRKRQYDEQG